MTTLFPMAKASLGLSITRDSVCLVEIQRNWRSITCRHISERLLPPDLIRLSPARPNIHDPTEFAECLRTLVKRMNLPQSVALSIPDLCGRTTVLSFSSFPSKKTERDSLVSWRFQQEMNISTDKARLAYCIFEPAKHQTDTIHVLATAVQHDIIEQYEQACLEVGLLPNSVGLAGLDVFDFYRTQIQENPRGQSRRAQSVHEESLFLYLANWGLSFIALQDGHPTFVRVKALPIARVKQAHSEPDPSKESPSVKSDLQEESEGSAATKPEPYSPLEMNHVANELVATLQYYFETQQQTRNRDYPIPLYVAEGLSQGENFLPAESVITNMLKVSTSQPPPLAVMNFTEMFSPQTNKIIMESAPQMRSLSALASVMVL